MEQQLYVVGMDTTRKQGSALLMCIQPLQQRCPVCSRMQFISLPHAHNSQTGTCIWGQSEVQGRKVYHWAGSHGQREPMGVTLMQTNPFFIPLTHHINTAAFSISYFSSSVCQYLLSFMQLCTTRSTMFQQAAHSH